MKYVPPDFAALTTPRPMAEWHEDFGAVLWWYLDNGHDVEEPPYAGTPLDDSWPWDGDVWAGATLVWTPLPRIQRFEPLPAPAPAEEGK